MMSKMRHRREVELLEASVPDNNNEYRPYRENTRWIVYSQFWMSSRMNDLDLLFLVTMQKLVSAITSYFMHRFTHNLNLGWVSTWMTLTYILPTVPNRNEWKLCAFLHVVNYMSIIIHVSQKFRGRGTPDPTGQQKFCCQRDNFWRI